MTFQSVLGCGENNGWLAMCRRTWRVCVGVGLLLLMGHSVIVAEESAENDSDPPATKEQSNKPTAHTKRELAGWTVRVDDRLLHGPGAARGSDILFQLEAKLRDIAVVVPPEKLKKLRQVTIVLDQSHGELGTMQYHPSADWLTDNGYAADLEKCVHIPRASELLNSRDIREQPWCVLHELAHAYHDQVHGFDDPRILEAYNKYKASGRGEKALLYDGKRVKHYALTNQMEFFAEMTEAYFGANDFFPFNRGELIESEPEILQLMEEIWMK
ncbi:MAG: metallopeptidase [Pirellulales bacterium]|nr:metallopeptidase [Pirellulales bacterium]